MNIGIAGVGKMGAAIAARLIGLGHKVAVWNRSAARTKPLADAGATVAATPADLAKGVDVVITILTDAAAADAVYAGPSGLLSADLKDKLFIEMSTVQPHSQIALAEKVRAKGGVFVECPVGGSTAPAKDGQLFGMAGGSESDFARARPLLDQMCRRVELCGPVGAGSTMKLAINLPLLVYYQALGEALALSRHLGLDPARAIDIFADSSGGANVMKRRGPQVAKMLAGGDLPTTFDLDVARKDLRSMLAEGQARGVELPVAERALVCFDEASKAGWGARDGSGQAVYWAHRGQK